MSHSTHVGFRRPPLCSERLGPAVRPRSLCVFCLPDFQSLAVGVGTILPRPPSPRTASVRDTPACALLFGVFLEPLPLESPAVGVGHKQDSFPFVRGTNGASGDNVPFAYIPDTGQRTQDSSERAASIMSKNRSGIFRHKELWLEIRNNSQCFSPHPSSIVWPPLFAGNAHGLTWNTCADEVDAPRFWIAVRKSANVCPSTDVGPVPT